MAETEKFSNLITALLPDAGELEKYFDRLWPLCRSITGNGLRKSIEILQEIIPLQTIEVASGTRVFDWTVPREWNIEDGWIEDENGEKVVDFRNNNLHVVGYSTPVDQWLELEELQKHLFSLPNQPEAIPYVTSYYEERWGFCLSHNQRSELRPGRYRAIIRSQLTKGGMTISHCSLRSTENCNDEILLSSNICHPSLANNELSGPLATAFLYRALSNLTCRRFTYRFVVIPETIGAIAYLSMFGGHLRESCRAGLAVTCCGDDRNITYKKTRGGNSLLDRIVENVLKNCGRSFRVVDFFPSGSDERQYSSPGFNISVGSLMRSMYGTEGFPEYHTSLDNKSFISFEALRETISLYLRVLLSFEENRKYMTTVIYGEPMLSPRGLYPTVGSRKAGDEFVERMKWLLNFSDGSHDLCEIADKAKCSVLDLAEIAYVLREKGLLIETI